MPHWLWPQRWTTAIVPLFVYSECAVSSDYSDVSYRFCVTMNAAYFNGWFCDEAHCSLQFLTWRFNWHNRLRFTFVSRTLPHSIHHASEVWWQLLVVNWLRRSFVCENYEAQHAQLGRHNASAFWPASLIVWYCGLSSTRLRQMRLKRCWIFMPKELFRIDRYVKGKFWNNDNPRDC